MIPCPQIGDAWRASPSTVNRRKSRHSRISSDCLLRCPLHFFCRRLNEGHKVHTTALLDNQSQAGLTVKKGCGTSSSIDPSLSHSARHRRARGPEEVLQADHFRRARNRAPTCRKRLGQLGICRSRGNLRRARNFTGHDSRLATTRPRSTARPSRNCALRPCCHTSHSPRGVTARALRPKR
jgi:hypothetical protein